MTLDEIRELTANNDHTSAYIAGCEYLTKRGLYIDHIIRQFKLLLWNRDRRGSFDYHDSERQYVLYGKMLDEAKEVLSEKEFQEFYTRF